MDIDLSPLRHDFITKPLLIGGNAMEFYELRKAGSDIDFVISPADYDKLVQQYPEQTKDLHGDLGLIVEPFELWTSICLFGYDQLISNAIEQGEYLVIALDKLLILKAIGMQEEKFVRDVRLIGEKIRATQYGKDYRPIDS